MNATPALEAQQRLVAALRGAACYPHSAGDIRIIETHISWVVLAGGYAYKLKKAVDLGFLDYSSLEKRRHACSEEVRLNRRTAPDIYIDVVAIDGTPDAPRVGGDAAAIEFAVRMRRFSRDDELDVALARGALTHGDITLLAAMIAQFHAHAGRPAPGEVRGTPDAVLATALQNFDQIEPLLQDSQARRGARDLRAWTRTEHARIAAQLQERQAGGFIRECHGDLHLANMVRHAGRIVAFDCIEFNPALRWIDVIDDLAFALMDLRYRGRTDYARLALDAYLERSGDFAGVALLPFYQIYRAMVRAKVAALRASQPGAPQDAAAAAWADCAAHLALADQLRRRPAPLLVITHGVSGSGKSHASGRLIEVRDWIRVRADVERKRIAGLGARAQSGAGLGQGLYSPAVTEQVYQRLGTIAGCLLAGGAAVIVDATFLKRAQRDLLREVAHAHRVPYAILALEAGRALHAERIAARLAAGNDASEATTAVLDLQTASREPLDAAENACAVHLAAADAIAPESLACLLESRAAVAPLPG